MFTALYSTRRRATPALTHSPHSYDDDEGEHKEEDAGGGDGDHNHETWRTDHPLGQHRGQVPPPTNGHGNCRIIK